MKKKLMMIGTMGHPLGRFVQSSRPSFQSVEWRNCGGQLPPLRAAYLPIRQHHANAQISQAGKHFIRILFHCY